MDVIHKKPLAESERAFSFSHIVVVNEAAAATTRRREEILLRPFSPSLSAIQGGLSGQIVGWVDC